MTIEDRNPRHPRSVRLTSNINDRLISLCDHLGVTPNSYLVGVIGKAITLDEQAYISAKNSSDMVKIASDMRDGIGNDAADIMALMNEPDIQEFLLARKAKKAEKQSQLDLS